ncbi:hypothetical protein MMC20_003502 [Loxospora ochrophaea]|nr:hypothetical protein [Loxospora ochrophaea]
MYQPIWYLSAAKIALGAGLIQPSKNYLSRFFFLLLSTFFCFQVFQSANKADQIQALLVHYAVAYVLYTHFFLFLQRLEPSPQWTTRQKIRWALALVFDPRWGIPRSSLPAFRPSDPAFVPSKRAFIQQRLVTAAWTFVAFRLYQRYPLNYDWDDFAPPQEHIVGRLGDVTPREVVVRTYTALSFVLPWYWLFTGLQSASSVVGVLLFGEAVEDWPPLFGPMSEAYSLRRYYGVFWHKIMRKALVAHSSVVVFDVLQLPRRSTVSRHMIGLLVFIMSGCIHAITAAGGIQCAGMAQIRYWAGMALAIMFEDAVVHLWHSIWSSGPQDKSASVLSSRWRFLGYFWVGLAHFWAVPKAYYPQVICLAIALQH